MSWEKRFKTAAIVALVLLVVPGLMAVRKQPTGIETIRQQGEVVVAIREGQASYFVSPYGAAGFEFELVQAFADELGVRLRLVSVDNAENGLKLLADHRVDFAVGMAVTDERETAFAFSVPVHASTQSVVCRRHGNDPLPANASALGGEPIIIASGNHHREQLQQLRDVAPVLNWTEVPGASEENLLGLVHAGRAACALVDANDWELHRHLFPDIRIAFDLPGKTLFSWAFPRAGDSSLRETANAWLARREADGTIAALNDRYYSHLQSLTQLDAGRFHKAIRSQLPQYTDLFRREARRNDIDWRLLAAVAYQESAWDPLAVSPTGAEGMMQLTLGTALDLGVEDRTDPEASIRAGARYLRQLVKQLPAEIPEQDRMWMALAAYNAGLAHVLDARELVRKRGGNPNSWFAVRDTLPLLKQEKWYSQTRYGYARGATQAIIYVRHVRRYYDLLVLASNSSERNDLMLAMGDTPRTQRM